jgi:hypothetical protein
MKRPNLKFMSRSRLSEWVRWRGLEPLLTVIAIGLFVWGLSITDLGRERRPDATILTETPPAPWVGVSPGRAAQFASPSDPTDPVGPYLLERRGSSLQVSASSGLAGGRYKTDLRALVPVGSADAFDVDRWGQRRRPALFAVSESSRRFDVTVFGLEGEPSVVASGGAELPPAREGDRTFLAGTWSGREPDLFVIDAGKGALGERGFQPWTLRIYSGESGFSELQLLLRLPDRIGPSLEPWWIDLRRLADSPTDIVLTSRDVETSTGKTEIHVLSGASQFQVFSFEAPTPIADQPGPSHQLLYHRLPGAGALLDIEVDGGVKIQEVPIGG